MRRNLRPPESRRTQQASQDNFRCEGDFDNVVLTDAETAATASVITREQVREILKFKKSFLRRLRAAPSQGRDRWQRFVLIKVDTQEATSMYPRLLPGATVLIDRHYNLLQPYRRNESKIYAAAKTEPAQSNTWNEMETISSCVRTIRLIQSA